MIFIAVICGWWFIALPFALIGAWFLPHFIELIIAGIAYDSLFGMIKGYGIFGYWGVLISIAIFVLAMISRRVVRY
jgi:hypothetical protein